MVAGEAGIEARRLVFVDECGANISLVPLYAWSRRGERAPAKAPRNWGKNITLLSSMSLWGMGPSLAVEGPTTREVFETYLETVLAPTLSPGQVVVMDNLSAHKGGRVREIIEGRGCELLYLPPICHLIRRTSTQLRKLSPSSRGYSERARSGAAKLW
jgi:transposase